MENNCEISLCDLEVNTGVSHLLGDMHYPGWLVEVCQLGGEMGAVKLGDCLCKLLAQIHPFLSNYPPQLLP